MRDGYGSGGASRNDADFIAAANPKAILEILASHQALYEALRAAEKALSAIRTDVLPLLGDTRVRDFHEEIDAARAALALADAAKGEK